RRHAQTSLNQMSEDSDLLRLRWERNSQRVFNVERHVKVNKLEGRWRCVYNLSPTKREGAT
ncbi:Hypothetical predicted protein, partial [Xyrichtys novacula]